MIQEDIRVAIDLGTTKVCATVGKSRPDGSVEVTGMGVAPSRGMQRGNVTDGAEVTEAVRAAVYSAEKEAGISVRSAYVGLGGSHIESRNQWTRVPNTGVSVVTQRDISRALQIARSEAANGGTHLLHVLPRSYALDGIYGVRNPLGMHASEMYIQTHVITGAPESIAMLKSVVEAAGVAVAGLVVQPVAAAEASLTPQEKDEGVILIDIGGGTTDVAVFYEGTIVHTNVLPVGGWQFTNDLVQAFNTTFDEAEKLKITHGAAIPAVRGANDEISVNSSGMDQPLVITRRELSQLIHDRAAEMLEMVRLKLQAPHLRDIQLNRYVLTGGGAKLDGFQALVRATFQGKVRTTGPAREVVNLPSTRQDPSYTASIGLLIWGMDNLPRDTHVGARKSVAAGDPGMFDRVKGWISVKRTQPQHRTPVGAGKSGS
ncbi:MAG: cell division protein FtsA [Chloroflexi bacterium]|nr:cell division protein FtsA [Chloroflexota bacterium]